MASIQFEIGGIPVSLRTSSARLVDLFADYFRYYQPQLLPVDSPAATLDLELTLAPSLDTSLLIDLSQAELIARTGVLALWRKQEGGGEALYLDCGVACFTIHPAAGRALALLRPQAFDQPQILANTYTLFALLLLLRARGRYHLHAAAVVSPHEKLWLICGAQRAGKTTLTTALGLSGWRPLSDDSLLVEGEGQDARLTALKKYFHLDDQLLTRWPGLARAERHHSYLHRTCVDGLGLFGATALAEQHFTHIDAILLPQITAAAPSRVELINPSTALRQLAEQSTFFQLWPTHTARQWQALTQLSANARCYRFHSGPDLLDDPTIAANLLNVEEMA